MRILLCSYVYSPKVGVIPTVSRLLVEEYLRAGHEVTLVTRTTLPKGERDDESFRDKSFRIVRHPSWLRLILLGMRADVIHFNNIAVRFLLPLRFAFKPIFVTHQTWLSGGTSRITLKDRIKRLLLRGVTNIAVSRPLTRVLPGKPMLMGNPFSQQEFLPWHDTPKDRDIVFIGGLNQGKGPDLLLQAVAQLGGRGVDATVTIIGDGPEREYLDALAASLGIASHVEFCGQLTEGRGQLIARHKVLVVPSRRSETFGLVALEGIASGCAIVASNSGGLPEVVGPCGVFFPSGNIHELTALLHRVLTDEQARAALVAPGRKHLEQFAPATIAAQYLALFEAAIG